MLLRSLALRDEAMALCDAAVLMLLWKLAPINDIFSDNAACTSCNSGSAHLSTPCAAASGLATTKDPSQQRCYVPETQNLPIDGVLRPSVAQNATHGIPSTERSSVSTHASSGSSLRRYEALGPPEEQAACKTLLGS